MIAKVGLNNCQDRQISWHLPEIDNNFSDFHNMFLSLL